LFIRRRRRPRERKQGHLVFDREAAMAKLILRFEAAVLKEIPIGKSALSIGRLPGNDVVIDNLAVSGYHARLVLDEDHYVIEDLTSLNGTFLNNQRVRRSSLKHGDAIVIGKHSLLFLDEGGISAHPAPAESEPLHKPVLGTTVNLDTKQRRDFLAQATTITGQASADSSGGHKELLGSLVVLQGKTDQREYILTSKLCVIGKSDLASVRLKGWFAPRVAAIINRREGRYDIAPPDKAGSTRINSDVLAAPRELRGGDVIQIGRVKMQFHFRE
jgi:pSer/pThr/pTyr-binding forkhead associated (FHA) protein